VRKKRFISGTAEVKVYVYRHPRNPEIYGFVDAMSFDDARKYIGRQVKLRAVWVDEGDCINAIGDEAATLSIVNSAFSAEEAPEFLTCHSCGVEFVGSRIQCQSARGGGRVYCSRKCQVKVAAKWSIRPARRTNV
jgi:hypothetical protein